MNTNNTKEKADELRAAAKKLLNAALRLPMDVPNNNVDHAVDCIIQAAMLEATQIISEAFLELAKVGK